MRFSALLLVVAFITSAPVAADNQISEPHALVYYQVSFSGNARDTQPQFGLRLDRTVREAGQPLELRSLLVRPAVMDLRFGNSGMESFTVAGVDYLARYRALHADETKEAGAEPAETGAQKPAAKEQAKKQADEDKLTMGKILDEAPMGYIIGAGIGLLLVVGVGG